MNYKLKKISGDASFREFYRLKKGKKTSIIVQANKEKFKNLILYMNPITIDIKDIINKFVRIFSYFFISSIDLSCFFK